MILSCLAYVNKVLVAGCRSSHNNSQMETYAQISKNLGPKQPRIYESDEESKTIDDDEYSYIEDDEQYADGNKYNESHKRRPTRIHKRCGNNKSDLAYYDGCHNELWKRHDRFKKDYGNCDYDQRCKYVSQNNCNCHDKHITTNEGLDFCDLCALRSIQNNVDDLEFAKEAKGIHEQTKHPSPICYNENQNISDEWNHDYCCNIANMNITPNEWNHNCTSIDSKQNLDDQPTRAKKEQILDDQPTRDKQKQILEYQPIKAKLKQNLKHQPTKAKQKQTVNYQPTKLEQKLDPDKEIYNFLDMQSQMSGGSPVSLTHAIEDTTKHGNDVLKHTIRSSMIHPGSSSKLLIPKPASFHEAHKPLDMIQRATSTLQQVTNQDIDKFNQGPMNKTYVTNSQDNLV